MKKNTFIRLCQNGLLLLIAAWLLSGCATQFSGLKTIPASSARVEKTYSLPSKSNSVVGSLQKVKVDEDTTFTDVAKHFDMGAKQLINANPGISQFKLRAGHKVLIPSEYILPPASERKGIVINLAAKRLFYFNNAQDSVSTYPVAVGRDGWKTPTGTTYVYRKKADPTWHVPKSIREAYYLKTGEEHPRTVAPGPDNPLGEYAIYLHLEGYLIHGTNNPASIGRKVSSGCIRMYNPDVGNLFDHVKRGTPVRIVNRPNQVGWQNNQLFLVVYSEQANEQQQLDEVKSLIENTIQSHPATVVDWNKVSRVISKHNGIPQPIGVANG